MKQYCALLALCAALACSGDPASPRGSIVVQTRTSRIDQDAGYSLHPEGFQSRFIPASGSVVVRDLPPGTHVFRLDGLTDNCSVAGGNRRIVYVGAGNATEIRFDVTCVAVTGVRRQMEK